MVIDDRIMVASILNYTQPAIDYNDENLFVVGSPHAEVEGIGGLSLLRLAEQSPPDAGCGGTSALEGGLSSVLPNRANLTRSRTSRIARQRRMRRDPFAVRCDLRQRCPAARLGARGFHRAAHATRGDDNRCGDDEDREFAELGDLFSTRQAPALGGIGGELVRARRLVSGLCRAARVRQDVGQEPERHDDPLTAVDADDG